MRSEAAANTLYCLDGGRRRPHEGLAMLVENCPMKRGNLTGYDNSARMREQ